MITILVRGASSPRPRLGSLMLVAVGRLRGWRRVRRDRLFLQALPDSMLKDLGLRRSEIYSVARFGPGDASRGACDI